MKIWTVLLVAIVLAGCGGSETENVDGAIDNDGDSTAFDGRPAEESPTLRALSPTVPSNLDTRCDDAVAVGAVWEDCEATNYAKTLEAPTEQVSIPFLSRFMEQSLFNLEGLVERAVIDPSWFLSLSLDGPRTPLSLSVNTPLTPLCATYGLPCTGDPYRYPEADGPDGKDFYETEADVTEVVFYDRECARLTGKLWVPKQATSDSKVPTIVITNGSVQAPQTAYSWAAQALVRAGYGVFTYDPRGQGQSDLYTPMLEQGSNLNPNVFWEGQVDAIDFFRSTPETLYPHAASCEGTQPTPVFDHNPEWSRLDRSRLGIAGHSLGAIGVSVVQGYGAPGAEPWPGLIDEENPVDVVVAWDSLITPEGEGLTTASHLQLPAPLYDIMMLAITQGSLPGFAPRVPSMSFFADYGFAPVPYLVPPDPEGGKVAFNAWHAAGVPVYTLGFQGTTHFDYSLLPLFPATSWCPDVSNGACAGGWGRPSITHYTVAWFDRWLKQAGEVGYDDADMRLIDDARVGAADRMSFHYHSARSFPDRFGGLQHCESIRSGCAEK
ncbi:alpha/beta hydrolase family protein [Marinobacter sp. SBS5]|uniref:alpha/beta hydrolase family protein n=1 Tax=Marinobacter sp. SBS5 TaxID=3401754 RepID=UPI003AAD00BD